MVIGMEHKVELVNASSIKLGSGNFRIFSL